MTTVNLCVDFPPNYMSLYDSIRTDIMELFNPNQFDFPNQFTFPPFDLSLPSLPTMPSTGLSICARIEQFVSEMCTKAVLLVFDAVLSFLDGIGIAIALPTLFGITLVDLLTKTFEELAALFTGPLLDDFSLTFDSATENLRRTLQNLAVEYPKLLLDLILGVWEDIKDLFPALPSLEDLGVPGPVPTLQELKDMLYAMIYPRTDLNYQDLFDFSLSGFDIDMSALLPESINPFSKLGSYDLEQGIKILLLKLTTLPFDIIVTALKGIGLSFSIGFCLLVTLTPL